MAVVIEPPKSRRITLRTSTGEVELDEPRQGASLEEIRAFNQAKYPQLATCGVDASEETINFKDVSGADVTGKRENVTFKPNVGTRG